MSCNRIKRSGPSSVIGAILALSMGSSVSQAYIGGFRADPAQFPASVRLEIKYLKYSEDRVAEFRSCSATKVAPRFFLTAAHCVYEGVVLQITASTTNSGSAAIGLGVRRITIHPTYLNAPYSKGSLDLAVIEVKRDTPYSVAPLADRPVGAFEKFYVGGYGFTSDLSDVGENAVPGLQIWATEPNGSRLEITGRNRNHLRYDLRGSSHVGRSTFSPSSKRSGLMLVFGPGFPFSSSIVESTQDLNSYAHIFSGDSGGGAFRVGARGNAAEVLGVNKSTSLPGSGFFSGAAVTETLTRVDTASEGGRWVQELIQ